MRSTGTVVRAIHWGRLIVSQLSRRIIGVLVTAFVFGIVAAMYGLAILQYLSEERLPPPPQAIVEHTMIAVPAAILIYVFTTHLKWPAFLILIRFAAGGVAQLVTRWRSRGDRLSQRSSSTFLMHVLFLHLASLAVILLINVLGSPEAAVLAILVAKAGVELFIARYDLADV